MSSLSELSRFVRITAASGLLAGALVDCKPTSITVPTPIPRVTSVGPIASPTEDLNRIIPTPVGEFLPSRGEKDMRITNAPRKYLEAPINPNLFDRSYLSELYSNLQGQSGSRGQRINTIRDNLSIILGSERNNGTALRIDEAGTFLTVAHTLTKNVDGKTPVTTFTDSVRLNVGIVAPISRMYLNLDSDIALYQAGDGGASKPIDNIQFDPAPLQPDTEVWSMGIYQPKGSERFDLHMATGFIVPTPSDTPDNLRNYIFAKGIRGIPGTSGGPIIDKDGKIVGIIKGVATDHSTNQEYTLIVPIRAIQTLIDRSTLYTLPTQPTR